MNRRTLAAIAFIQTLATGAALAQTLPLATSTGNQIGLTVSDYRYTESGVSLKATNWGIDYAGTWAAGSGWFLRAELRYATGDADYSGSGTKTGNPDWYYEVRGLAGKDFSFGSYVLSPYAGLGYRYLFNDLRGTTSTGAIGYRRESTYYTLPIGVGHRMPLSRGRLSTTAEFDYFVRGHEDTWLSDLVGHDGITGADNVRNVQHRGYGWRLSSTYEFGNWSVGPYVTYWHVDSSDVATTLETISGVTYILQVYEPTNNTREIGLKASYRF